MLTLYSLYHHHFIDEQMEVCSPSVLSHCYFRHKCLSLSIEFNPPWPNSTPCLHSMSPFQFLIVSYFQFYLFSAFNVELEPKVKLMSITFLHIISRLSKTKFRQRWVQLCSPSRFPFPTSAPATGTASFYNWHQCFWQPSCFWCNLNFHRGLQYNAVLSAQLYLSNLNSLPCVLAD